MAWLVAGLGNPGSEYAATRHNIGAMVADVLARRSGERFRKVRFLPVELAEMRSGEERVLLARSLRYMNESGPSFASLAKKRDVDPSNVIAVHDDIDLVFGALRIKRGGSSAGHNGLRSLQSALGTPDFLRVRLGVGRPPGRQDPADFVLEAFRSREVPDVELLVEIAADAVAALVTGDLASAQDRYTRSGA